MQECGFCFKIIQYRTRRKNNLKKEVKNDINLSVILVYLLSDKINK